MKITTLQLLIAGILTGLAQAHSAHSQEMLHERVSLSIRNGNLKTLLRSIEQQVDVQFSYQKDLINAAERVSLTVQNQTVEEVLKQVLLPRQIMYRVLREKQIVLLPAVIQRTELLSTPKEEALAAEIQAPEDQIVTGVVTDEANKPLPGVSVVVKSQPRGTTTDAEGRYRISVANDKVALLFSFVGYMTREEVVGKRTVINLSLTVDDRMLNEVIVVGYGTVKKSDLTGSVSSVKADAINKLGLVNVEQALQGRAPGVNVIQNSGVPGAGATIQIRGMNSMTGSDPLFIIDGVAIDNTPINSGVSFSSASRSLSPLSMINPSDIASIEILKDASATAIYGARGANGVVLITTKSGKEGKGKVSFDAEYGVSRLVKKVDLLEASDFVPLRNESFLNAGTTPAYRSTFVDSARTGKLPNYDWQNAIYRQGSTQNYNLTVQGANKDLRYFISGGLTDIRGIIIRSDFKRYGFRANVDAAVKPWLRVGTRLNFASINSNEVNTSTSYGTTRGLNSVVMRAFAAFPVANPFNDDGTVSNSLDGIDSYSPLVAINANNYNNTANTLINNIYVDIQLSKSLRFNTSGSNQLRQSNIRFYQTNDLPAAFSIGGWARTSDNNFRMLQIENTLHYKHKFSAHDINAVIGQAYQTFDNEVVNTSNQRFPNDVLGYYGVNTAAVNEPDAVQRSVFKLLSYFGRVNYVYDNKLLLTVTGRVDGSSKFAKNNKYAFFPAAAVAYKLSEERFLATNNVITNLKLRLSYGLSGNQNLNPYQSLAQIVGERVPMGTDAGAEVLLPIYYPANLSNPDLKWETTTQWNGGIDLSVLKNRVTLTADYFTKNTRDLLVVGYRISAISGFNTATQNLGSMKTSGVDIGLDFRIMSRKDFSWNSILNYSRAITKIASMGTDYITSGYNHEWISSGTQRLIIGEELGVFYGYRRTGISQFSDFKEFYDGNALKSLDQIKALYSPTALYTPVSDAYPTNIPRRPGEQQYQDLNGDKLINEKDNQIIGRAQPKFTFGLQNDFVYKNLDLAIFIDGRYGNDIANVNNFALLSFADQQGLKKVNERWTPDNPSNEFPRLNRLNNGFPGFVFSDRFIEDGSFVRLQNITLGYTLNKVPGLPQASLRCFLSATNLHTFSKYTGYTPDVSLTASYNLSLGHDNAVYPLPTTVRAGVNLNF